MAAFFIAIGNGHQLLTERAKHGLPKEVSQSIGGEVLWETSQNWSMVEWCGETDSRMTDIVWAANNKRDTDVFVVGYITEPEAISRKSGSSTSEGILRIDGRLFSENMLRQAALHELNGSYAILRIASNSGDVTLCSDRWASRTMWRAYVDRTWCLASHPALLWHIAAERLPVEPSSLGGLLLRARPVGDHALLASGKRNLPGTVHTLLSDGHERTSRWYQPAYTPLYQVSEAEWGERVADALKGSATRLRGVMEKPLLFLSGGLDSRLALATLNHVFQPTAVTLLDAENLEMRIAREVAEALRVPHRKVERDKEWYLRGMTRSALLQGGNYHPVHSHFFEGLKQIADSIPYDAAMLGDFLEAFQKLLGNNIDSLGPSPGPEGLFNHILSLDGQYAVRSCEEGLRFLIPEIRGRVLDEWRDSLLPAIKESLEVSQELPVSVDYLLRWRAAYEVATYGMIEDLRAYGPERSLSMDTRLHDLMLTIPGEQRKSGMISKRAMVRLAPQLSGIRNANTALPMAAPAWSHKMAKVIRPRLGRMRRRINHLFGITNAALSSSWTDCHLLAATDESWAQFIESRLFDNNALPDTIFDQGMVKGVWKEFRAGNFELGFSIDSLLTFAIIHKQYGSGGLS
jgi:hypothetical protein